MRTTAIFKWCATRMFKTCNTWLDRGTHLFSLRLSNKKMTTANTMIAVPEWVKIILIFVRSARIIYFLECHRSLIVTACHEMKKLNISAMPYYKPLWPCCTLHPWNLFILKLEVSTFRPSSPISHSPSPLATSMHLWT